MPAPATPSYPPLLLRHARPYRGACPWPEQGYLAANSTQPPRHPRPFSRHACPKIRHSRPRAGIGPEPPPYPPPPPLSYPLPLRHTRPYDSVIPALAAGISTPTRQTPRNTSHLSLRPPPVIPAHAGIHTAVVGATRYRSALRTGVGRQARALPLRTGLGSRFRGNDGRVSHRNHAQNQRDDGRDARLRSWAAL